MHIPEISFVIPLYDSDYNRQVEKELMSLGSIGVFFKTPSEYTDTFSKYTSFSTLGAYLSLINNKSIVISLSDAEIPITQHNKMVKSQELKALNLSFFLSYVKVQQSNQTFQSIEQSQIGFIKTFDIRFAIASKKAFIPLKIQELVEKEITNPITGERFLVLNPEKVH